MPGFNIDSTGVSLQNVLYADNVDFSGSTAPTPTVTTDGQLLIGSTASPHIKVGNIISPLGTLVLGYSGPNITADVKNGFAFNYKQISHSDSPYTVGATDYYLSCDPTAGTIIILLPNAPSTDRPFTIKDRTGKASTNNISVSTVGGSVTIDGQTTYTMSGNFDAINLIFNSTSYEVF